MSNSFADITFKTPGVFTVCAYSEFKPIIYGNGEGFEADLLRAIAKLWHVKIKFYPENVYEGIWRLPSRQYTLCDVSAGGISPTDYRMLEDTAFSIITTKFNQSLLIRKADYKTGKITSYHSFKNTNMKIGVVPGTTGEKFAHRRAAKNGLPLTLFVEYPSESDLIPALINHKIDAIARGEIGNDYQAELHPDLITITRKKYNEGFAFAIDKSNIKLQEALNKAIRLLTNNGEITYKDWHQNPNIFNERLESLPQALSSQP